MISYDDMIACTQVYSSFINKLEFRESEVKTEVKQGKFVEFISQPKGYFRETYKSQRSKCLLLC